MLVAILWMTVFAGYGQEVSAGLSQNNIRIGEQVYLTLTVSNAPKGTFIKWPGISDTINKFIEVVDSVIEKTATNAITSKKYLITSFDSGYYKIPAFEFKLNGMPALTNELTLAVQTVAVDTTKDFNDIKEIRAETYTFSDKLTGFFQWLLKHWYVPLAVLVGLTVLIVYLVRRRRRNRPAVTEPEIFIPFHEQLLAGLDALDKKQLWQNNQTKLYYVELTDLLRTYIEKRFQVMAHEQTTVQLMNNLKTSGITRDSLEMLKNILTLADMVKFAKAVPIDYENQGALDNARSFAINTRVKEEPKND